MENRTEEQTLPSRDMTGLTDAMARVRDEISKAIVGQAAVVEGVLTALLAGGGSVSSVGFLSTLSLQAGDFSGTVGTGDLAIFADAAGTVGDGGSPWAYSITVAMVFG